MELFAERAAALGLDAQLHEHDLAALRAHPGHPGEEAPRDALVSATATLPGADPGGPRIVLNGHLDVVHEGAETWAHPPFGGVREGGFVHGRGSVDMKAGVAAALHAVAALHRAGVRPAGDVVVQAVPSEEDGGLGTFAELERDDRWAAALIPEPTGFEVVCAQGGALTFAGEIRGRAAHGALRREGLSAIDRYVRVHTALQRHEDALNDGVVHPLMRERDLPYPVSVGRVEAGRWSSQVPDLLRFEGRLGVPIGDGLADARAAFERVVAEAAGDGPPPEVRWTGGQFSPSDTDAGHPVVRAAAAAVQAERGAAPPVTGVPYGSDMRLFAERGIPAVMLGTGGIERAHGVDERVSEAEVVALARIIVRFLVRHLTAPGSLPPWRNSSSAPCCATPTRPTRRSGSRPTRRARCASSDDGVSTFEVRGHHYALVHVTRPGAGDAHAVRGRARRRARLAAAGLRPARRASIPHARRPPAAPGSPSAPAGSPCRNEPPYALKKDEDDRGREVDALRALALRMRDTPQRGVADAPAHARRPGLRRRGLAAGLRVHPRAGATSSEPPGEEIADFEEYTRLYWEAWGEPVIRWLLSTVPTAMIFDDHDVHDDWNISDSWVRGRARACRGGRSASRGAFMSYWVYQHLGNLAPDELHEDEMYDTVCNGEGDRGAELRRFALKADRETEGARWSYSRDYGGVRVVVLDSRAGRVLDDGNRSMLDEDEWDWVERAPRRRPRPPRHRELAADPARPGDALPRGVERGDLRRRVGPRRASWIGEKIRRGARPRALGGVRQLLRAPAAPHPRGRRRRARPAAGDDHAGLRRRPPRLPRGRRVPARRRRAERGQPGGLLAVPQPARRQRAARRALRRLADRPRRSAGRSRAPPGSRTPTCAGASCDGPWFDNQVATLELHDRQARLRIERTLPGEWEAPRLHECLSKRLA